MYAKFMKLKLEVFYHSKFKMLSSMKASSLKVLMACFFFFQSYITFLPTIALAQTSELSNSNEEIIKITQVADSLLIQGKDSIQSTFERTKQAKDSITQAYHKKLNQSNSLLSKEEGTDLELPADAKTIDLPEIASENLPNIDIVPDVNLPHSEIGLDKLTPPKVAELPTQQLDIDNVGLDKMDKLALPENALDVDKQAEQWLGQQNEIEFLQQQSNEMGDISQLNAPPDMESLSEISLPEIQKLAKAENIFAGHEKEIGEAEDLMQSLKKKYAEVPDSRDLSKATKKNSLKDEPFGKRIIYGSNFQILRGNPLSLDIAPQIQYRFTKKLSTGFGILYRIPLGIPDKLMNDVMENVYGGSLMTQLKIKKGVFVQAEWQYLHIGHKDESLLNTPKKHNLQHVALLGIGKQISFGKKLKAHSILSYDFLYTYKQSPFPSAWSLRFGFQMVK